MIVEVKVMSGEDKEMRKLVRLFEEFTGMEVQTVTIKNKEEEVTVKFNLQ